MAMAGASFAVKINLLLQHIERLLHNRCQNVSTDLSGSDPGIGIARDGDPNRQLRLNRARQRSQLNLATTSTLPANSGARPKTSHRLDSFEHQVFALVVRFRSESEIRG